MSKVLVPKTGALNDSGFNPIRKLIVFLKNYPKAFDIP